MTGDSKKVLEYHRFSRGGKKLTEFYRSGKMKGMDREDRGVVIYTAGWVVGYVVACVFHIYASKDNEYTMAQYIHDFKSLGGAYMLAYFLSMSLLLVVFDDWFEKNKMGWIKRVSLSLATLGFLLAILDTFFDFPFFPFNFHDNSLLSNLFVSWVLIVWPVSVGLFIVFLFAEALGIEYS